MRRLFPLVATLLGGATSAQEPTNPYLAQAKGFYQVLDYEKCLERIEQAPKWKGSIEQDAQVSLYGGLCAYQLGRLKDASARFDAALRADPAIELPPYTSPKIVEVFRAARRRVHPPAQAPVTRRDPPEDAPVKEEPALLPTPPPPRTPVTLAEPTRSRVPGPLPLGLAAGGAVAAGACAVLGLQAKSLEQQANDAPFESDALALGRSARGRATAANVALGVSAVAFSAAVVSYLLQRP